MDGFTRCYVSLCCACFVAIILVLARRFICFIFSTTKARAAPCSIILYKARPIW
uniref:Uncharacterized protein n=1 Tax=Arundo donax TaxID=35708 RepID=A0A0A9C378_ARUDO